MQKKTALRTAPVLLAAACATVLAITLCVLAHPATAMADNAVAYSTDASGNRTYYSSVDDAVNAGYDGAVIVMDADWNLGNGRLTVTRGKSLTIDMNGHKMSSSAATGTVVMEVDSYLKLTSSAPASDIACRGYAKSDGSTLTNQSWGWRDLTVNTSGLITNTSGSAGGSSLGSGVWQIGGSLVLENVAVSGCSRSGLMVFGDSKVTMKNALVCYNRTPSGADGNGGGIRLSSDSDVLYMDNSHIFENYATNGGGILVPLSATVNLENGSTISGNTAENGGGGIYCINERYTIQSNDGTGTVSGNAALQDSGSSSSKNQSGGGIHVESTKGNDSALIQGITIKDNYSAYDGGGVELDKEHMRLVNCTITGNFAKYDGGGVFVYNDDNLIDGCTITGNYCASNGGNYEGGGIFVSYHYDVELGGKCTITGNTRGKDSGNADDVFLSTLSGGAGKAYITGTLAKGSNVGVRTGIAGDRRVAKSFNPDTKECLFADMDGYYISYGTDEGGDAWQRHATKEFAVTVDGKQVGTYKQGSSVSVKASSGSDKLFKCWDAEKSSTGIFNDETKWSEGLSFTMPQHEVNLVGSYVTRTSDVKATLKAPQPGSDLSAEGTLLWTAIDGEEKVSHSMDITVAWYEKGSDGSLAPASGTAKAGTTYVARFSASQDVNEDRAFALNIDASKIAVTLQGEEPVDLGAAEASVDASGTLSVATNEYKTADTVVRVEPVSVSFPKGMSKEEFMKAFPRSTTGLTRSGSVVDVPLKWPQDFDGLFDDNDELMVPEPNPKELILELDQPKGAVLPDDFKSVACHLTVVNAPVDVDEPTVDPGQGTYSAVKQPDLFDKDGRLKLTASCTTDGAEIKYSLDRMVNGEWEEVCSEQPFGSGIALAAPDEAGAQTNYRLQVWAEKDGFSSSVRTLCYSVANDEQLQKVTVTVNGTDTGLDPQTKELQKVQLKKGGQAVIEAPKREGYVFEKWIVDGQDRPGYILTINSVEEDTTVTAVYNPVVSELAAGFAEPIAHNELAASGTVQAKAGDSDEYFDIESYFIGEGGKANVTWSPEGDVDGKAEHMRSYTAAMTLKSDAAKSGVKYVISPDVKILLNEVKIEGGSAYIAQAADGTKSLCIAFESTGPLENPAFDHSLGTVELSYEQALAYQAGQDADKKESWGLPKEVEAKCKCGCTVPLDITWDKVTGFDKDNFDEQTLTVTGKVIFPSYVDPQDDEGHLVSKEVIATVKVAAAEQVAQPTASVEPGKHAGTQQVGLFCDTEDAVIHYTVDGSEPTADSPAYDGTPIEVAHSETVKAKAFRDGWKPSDAAEFAYTITHQVSFDSAGGSAVEAQTVDDGTCAAEPSAPTMDGWTFLGWYLEGGERYSFADEVTADVALYAHWAKSGEPVQAFTVVFDTDGGSAIEAQTVEQGKCAQRPAADPTKDGYDFAGWFADKELTKEFDFGAPITESTIVYAKWTESQDGGSGQGDGQGGSEPGQAVDGSDSSVNEAAADSAVPATGDAVPAFAAAAVAIVAIAAAAVLAMALRRRKN